MNLQRGQVLVCKAKHTVILGSGKQILVRKGDLVKILNPSTLKGEMNGREVALLRAHMEAWGEYDMPLELSGWCQKAGEGECAVFFSSLGACASGNRCRASVEGSCYGGWWSPEAIVDSANRA